jgi:ATP phosphoribosyltransferase regulatory subunit
MPSDHRKMTSAPPDVYSQADLLVGSYERAGYARVAPAILQPAEPFLDLAGEDMRRHMYLLTDSAGHELCLRPDLTIPVARDYLASSASARPAGLCYLGTVFRDPGSRFPLGSGFPLGAGEFLQAGIESFGRTDTAAADAEALSLGLEATAHYGIADPAILTGDVSLFSALIAALRLAPAWKRRLLKDFNRKATLAEDLQRLALAPVNGRPEHQGVLAALADANPKAAHALVTDLLSIAGISAVGGRSIGEIADRFVEQAELGASHALPGETRALIERFLAVAGTPDDAVAALRALAEDAGISLDPALDLFESRTGFLAASGVDVTRIRFETGFGRGVDYYTGFVFELHDRQGRADGQLVAGGRYDALLTRLGSTRPVPAVGLAVWIERLAALGAGVAGSASRGRS